MQLQQTPLRSHGSYEQAHNAALRAWFTAQVVAAFADSDIVSGLRSAPRMQAVFDPEEAWARRHSQQMPLLAQSSLVQGHIWILISWLAHCSRVVAIKVPSDWWLLHAGRRYSP